MKRGERARKINSLDRLICAHDSIKHPNMINTYCSYKISSATATTSACASINRKRHLGPPTHSHLIPIRRTIPRAIVHARHVFIIIASGPDAPLDLHRNCVGARHPIYVGVRVIYPPFGGGGGGGGAAGMDYRAYY